MAAPSKFSSIKLNGQTLTASGNTLSVNGVAVGGGSISSTTQEIDFGTFETTVTQVVTGLSWVGSGTVLVASLGDRSTISGNSLASPMEASLEEIVVTISDKVAGVGFTINAYAPNGANGKFLINIIGVG